MDAAVNVVSIGGGEGQSHVAEALIMSMIPGLRATMITAAFDDGFSTGALRRKENVAGYYGDVTRVLGGLRSALYDGRDWLPNKFAVRFASGIAEGETFGDLFADLFGGTFGELGMRGAYRQKAIKTVCTLTNIDEIDDDTVRELLMEAFEYPFEADNFPQHSFRNLFLFTLERIAKRKGLKLSRALDALHAVYEIPGKYRVMPVTWQPAMLKARTKSGETIKEQFHIDFRDRDPNFKPFDEIEDIWLDPPVAAAEETKRAILEADAVMVSCGSLKGNVQALFLVEGMKEALQERAEWFAKVKRSPLPILYVVNLLNEPWDTLSGKPYTASDIVDLVEAATGQRPNCVIYDTTDISRDDAKRLFPKEKIKLGGLRSYELSSRFDRLSLLRREVSMVVSDENPHCPQKIVHDPKKLAKVFAEIFSGVRAGALL